MEDEKIVGVVEVNKIKTKIPAHIKQKSLIQIEKQNGNCASISCSWCAFRPCYYEQGCYRINYQRNYFNDAQSADEIRMQMIKDIKLSILEELSKQ